MRRRLFTVAAGVSAVVCVAVCVLWLRSYTGTDYLSGHISSAAAGSPSRTASTESPGPAVTSGSASRSTFDFYWGRGRCGPIGLGDLSTPRRRAVCHIERQQFLSDSAVLGDIGVGAAASGLRRRIAEADQGRRSRGAV